MSKLHLELAVIAAVVFLVLNVVQFPRGPKFDCAPSNGGSHAEQYGFPFVFVQRSVSPSACEFADKQPGDSEQTAYYGTHHTKPINAVFDAVIGLLGAGLLYLGLKRLAKDE